jgi:hypothetical protein
MDKLTIINTALARCGAEPIVTLVDVNKRALLAIAQYDVTLKEVINDTTWNFATSRVRLTKSTVPLFQYACSYSYASNVVRILELNKTSSLQEITYRVEGRKVVTDYDDKVVVVTITRSSTTATVTQVGHLYSTGDSVNISGATQTQYNGTFTITVLTANTYSYAVTGSPATPATGSIHATKETNVLYARVLIFETDETLWNPSFIKAFYLKLAEDMAYSLVQSAALQQAIIQEAERYLRRARSYNSQEGTPESRYPEDSTFGIRQ